MDNLSSQSTPQQETDMESVKTLADAITKAINDNKGDKRFVDLPRVPLICLSITEIHKALDEIKGDIKDMMVGFNKNFVSKDQFWPVRTVVFGLVGLILAGVVGALITLVLRK